ncbi:unnamed protein product, partial [marine sediment metagenome]
RRFLDNKFICQEQVIQRKIKRLSRVVQSLKSIIIEQHTHVESTQKKIHEQTSYKNHTIELATKQSLLQKEIIGIEAQRTQTQKSITELQNLHTKQKEDSIQYEKAELSLLHGEIRYKEIKACMQSYEKEAKELGYNATDHKAKEAQKESLKHTIEKQKAIADQLPLQNERKKQILDLCNQLRTLTHQRNALEKKTLHVKKIDAQIHILQNELLKIEQSFTIAQTEKEQLLQNKGSITTQYKKIEIYKEKHKKIRKEIQQKNSEQTELNTIAHTMSKDGIQALLIESVIPEIESEANELLSRLTNNQTQVMIESLKDLKNGGTRETLDIFISDSLGLRPYELFSGGETFRIDFALRIAISKLV